MTSENIHDGSSSPGKRWTKRKRESLLFHWSALIVFFHVRNKLAWKLLPVHAGGLGVSVSLWFLLLLPFPSPCQRRPVIIQTKSHKTSKDLLISKWIRIYFWTERNVSLPPNNIWSFYDKTYDWSVLLSWWQPWMGWPSRRIQWQIKNKSHNGCCVKAQKYGVNTPVVTIYIFWGWLAFALGTGWEGKVVTIRGLKMTYWGRRF